METNTKDDSKKSKELLINQLELTLFGAGIALLIVSVALSPTNLAQLYIVFTGAVVWFVCYHIGFIIGLVRGFVVIYKLW